MTILNPRAHLKLVPQFSTKEISKFKSIKKVVKYEQDDVKYKDIRFTTPEKSSYPMRDTFMKSSPEVKSLSSPQKSLRLRSQASDNKTGTMNSQKKFMQETIGRYSRSIL